MTYMEAKAEALCRLQEKGKFVRLVDGWMMWSNGTRTLRRGATLLVWFDNKIVEL